MKALCWHGHGDVRVDDVAEPKIEAPTDVIIKITSTAICGSDLHLLDLDGYMPTMETGDILGHEPMGIVVEVGSAVTKVKKGDGPETVRLVRTPDVLATASAKVHGNAKRPVLMGFAAETHDVEAYARGKLTKKRLDLIVANDVSQAGAGFGSDSNRVVVFDSAGERLRAEGSKRDVAKEIWGVVLERRVG